MTFQGGIVILAICLIISLQGFIVSKVWDTHSDVAGIRAMLVEHADALHHDSAEGILEDFYGIKARVESLEEHTAGHLHLEDEE